jgi:hypothetical protein
MRKIFYVFLIFTAYSAFAQTAGGTSDNNINNIVNDIRKNPIDLSVRKYNLRSMNGFSSSPVDSGITISRRKNGYGNQFFTIQYINFSWYNVNRFVFEKMGMSLDNGIVIGDNYDKIKKLNIAFGEYNSHYRHGYKFLFSGDKFDEENPFLNDTILVFKNNLLTEIHINFVKVNIDKDISKILINEWKTYSAHYPQWNLLFSDNGTFSFTYIIDINGKTTSKGIWRLVFDNDCPKVELIFDDEENFNDGRYNIDKLRENEFRINLGGMMFFYPYTFENP